MAELPDGIEPVFLDEQTLLALHADALELYGGPQGFEYEKVCSIAAFPRQKYHYDESFRGIQELAAALAFAIAKEFHAFTDGNKRTSLGALVTFLGENNYDLIADEDEARDVILALADGQAGIEDMVQWVRENTIIRFFN